MDSIDVACESDTVYRLVVNAVVLSHSYRNTEKNTTVAGMHRHLNRPFEGTDIVTEWLEYRAHRVGRIVLLSVL